jgi:glycosyltransferase involved in cell wall biosynthesis
MDHPFYSIITPSLLRQSLLQTCDSVTKQTYGKWEHFVICDVEQLDQELLKQIEHPQRTIIQCPHPHRDGGNTCRRSAWPLTSGQWCYYLDDDNFLADEQVLADIHAALSPLPEIVQMGLFPILRLGHLFYCNPPRSCFVDTLNFCLRREIGQWPDTNCYGSDGYLIDGLMAAQVKYAAFPDHRPIAILPKISYGK